MIPALSSRTALDIPSDPVSSPHDHLYLFVRDCPLAERRKLAFIPAIVTDILDPLTVAPLVVDIPHRMTRRHAIHTCTVRAPLFRPAGFQ